MDSGNGAASSTRPAHPPPASGGSKLSAIAWVVWAGLLLLAAPLPEYIWISVLLGYTSHDTTPWTGAGAGVLVALAGLVLIAGVIRNAVRKTRRVQAAAR